MLEEVLAMVGHCLKGKVSVTFRGHQAVKQTNNSNLVQSAKTRVTRSAQGSAHQPTVSLIVARVRVSAVAPAGIRIRLRRPLSKTVDTK